MPRLLKRNWLSVKKKAAKVASANSPESSTELTLVTPQAREASLPVVGSSFGTRLLLKAIRLVLQGSLSLRAASRACQIIDQCAGGHGLDVPCPATIQNYILRLGLFQIRRVDQRRTDWIWMLDHTIPAGTTKCLVVMAISLEDFRRLCDPLTHNDVTVLDLIPVETSNGEVVWQQLEELSKQYGEPRATVTDRGSDLKKGVELFQQNHPNVASYYDVVHLVSRTIKRIFESHADWEVYRQACCSCANWLRQSALAHLKPPRPKTKARYMNFDREVRWAARALAILDRVREDRLTDRQRARLPRDVIEQRLGWLDSYRTQVSLWLEVIAAGKAINQLVRKSGYHSGIASEVRLLGPHLVHAQSQSLVNEVADEIAAMCRQPQAPNEAIPGSTECLESLIGRGKRLLYHNHNSLTRHILSLAAATANLTADLLQQVCSTCRLKHVAMWAKEHLPVGLQSSRREDLGASAEEIKLRKLLETAIPNF